MLHTNLAVGGEELVERAGGVADDAHVGHGVSTAPRSMI